MVDEYLIKALRCFASSYDTCLCYSDKYNETRKTSEKAMTCNTRVLNKFESFIPCPYMQDKYDTSEDEGVYKLINKAADELEKIKI